MVGREETRRSFRAVLPAAPDMLFSSAGPRASPRARAERLRHAWVDHRQPGPALPCLRACGWQGAGDAIPIGHYDGTGRSLRLAAPPPAWAPAERGDGGPARGPPPHWHGRLAA